VTEEKKSCFIIMPITTPEPFIDAYRDGAEHFRHVLECLFIPSVESAGYLPILPKAQGADLIHAEIIRNIEQSDLVLCDMSCLNPNVFFEFGIRTSLNKPVCIVKDELTVKVPFDTGILNHHEYKRSLEPWDLPDEIKKLSEHIKSSDTRSDGKNTLWKYFGLRSEARAYEGATGTEAKIDYLTMQMDSLRQQIGNLQQADLSPGTQSEKVNIEAFEKDLVLDILRDYSDENYGLFPFALSRSINGDFLVDYFGQISTTLELEIKKHVKLIAGENIIFRSFPGRKKK